MELSKSERMLAMGVGGVVLLLAIDHYALTPLLDEQTALETEREVVLKDINRGQNQMKERKRLTPQWKNMLNAGLKDDPASAESQVLHALRDWARESGLTLSSLKPERPESKESLKEVLVQATATGGMEGVAKFMYKIQSAKFPLKVTEFQTSARNDTNDALTLQVKVSTLYMVREKVVAQSSAKEVAR